jgi:ABC-2 type transport system ATP-binding protein
VLAALGLADVSAADGQVSAVLGGQAPEKVNAELVHAGVPVAGLETVRPSLEDLFVELTGEGFNVNG